MSVRGYPAEVRAAAVADYQSGMTLDQVAKKNGVSPTSVAGWLDAAGIKRRPASAPLHRSCTVDGCNEPHRARGYCGLHYNRIVRGAKPRGNWVPFDTEARIEDCRWMASTGEGLAGAARRIGISSDALWSWLKRYDVETLAVLTAQDPLPLNTSRATFHGAGIRVTT